MSDSDSDAESTRIIAESPCPGWASNLCATCTCHRQRRGEPPPKIVAHKGALFDGTYRGNRLPSWMVPHPDDIREMERLRAARMAKRMMRLATEGPAAAGDTRRRALGILKWAENKWSATPVGSRDGDIADAIYYLGGLVNMGFVTRDEVLDTILAISDACGHSRDNKSHQEIERDVDRGLAAAARDGISVDLESFDD